MRANIYTMVIITLSLITSCKSIDKMVEKGDYENAFNFAIDKLVGEKNKKTKYVKGIEKAYIELNRKDFVAIERLNATESVDKWEDLIDVYSTIEHRSDKVRGLLPLISEDGYIANLELYNYTSKKAELRNIAAITYYKEGKKYLTLSEENNTKSSAIRAYSLFERAKMFNANLEDLYSYMAKAEALGITHVSIDVVGNAYNHKEDLILEKLANLNLYDFNNKWTKYSFFDANKTYDKYIVIEFNNLEFDKEKELNNNYEVKKWIDDGKEPLKDKKGNIVKDSLGKEILVDKKKEVIALISEIFREKRSSASATVLLYDNVKSKPVANVPVNVYHNFKDSAVRFIGDRRALNNEVCNRLKDHIADFPSDRNIAYELSNSLVYGVEDAIKSFRI